MVQVVEDNFGNSFNPITKLMEPIKRFTLTNDAQMSVQVITLGATITSIKVPDSSGNLDDVVLGFDNVKGYDDNKAAYFGTTIGRVCNRVANGTFMLNGKEVEVNRNYDKNHQLHGGAVGFDRMHWKVVSVNADGVTMQYISLDGEEGYPGRLTATVTYTLTANNCLQVIIEAETTKPTPVNMTNHVYFNLAGHGAGSEALLAHDIVIYADKRIETAEPYLIPTGVVSPVEGTPYDLRQWDNLGYLLTKLEPIQGFDVSYAREMPTGITSIAKTCHRATGRQMEVLTNQPSLVFYTSNNLPDIDEDQTPIEGKAGAQYVKYGALCLETQQYADAVNQPTFPSIILNPGEKYNHVFHFKFCAGK